MKNYLAIDLGASSGRAILGQFDGQTFKLTELHRFPNGPVQVGNGIFWDIHALFREIKTGLQKALDTGCQLDGALYSSLSMTS